MHHRIIAAVLALWAACAQAGPEEERALPTPDAPQSRVAGEATEPEINIIEQAEGLVYEYRVRGRLYMVKVQPQIGPPYYFLDTNGDGILDVRRDSPMDIAVQQWILFSW